MDHLELIDLYKKKFPSLIYDWDYDKFVVDPETKLKLLISWLGWSWNSSFLFPHKSSRPISTASNVQARSAIHSKSLSSWKNYSEMLEPAISVISERSISKDLIK